MPTIVVYWSPTRSPKEKEAVARDFIETMVEKGNANPEDVLIVFQNIEEGDAFRASNFVDTSHSSNQDSQ